MEKLVGDRCTAEGAKRQAFRLPFKSRFNILRRPKQAPAKRSVGYTMRPRRNNYGSSG